MASPKRIYGFKNHMLLLNFFVFGSIISKLLGAENQFLFLKHIFLHPLSRPLKSATRGRQTAPLSPNYVNP